MLYSTHFNSIIKQILSLKDLYAVEINEGDLISFDLTDRNLSPAHLRMYRNPINRIMKISNTPNVSRTPLGGIYLPARIISYMVATPTPKEPITIADSVTIANPSINP